MRRFSDISGKGIPKKMTWHRPVRDEEIIGLQMAFAEIYGPGGRESNLPDPSKTYVYARATDFKPVFGCDFGENEKLQHRPLDQLLEHPNCLGGKIGNEAVIFADSDLVKELDLMGDVHRAVAAWTKNECPSKPERQR